jgi:nucleoside-diphosphate-sugar epimerase
MTVGEYNTIYNIGYGKSTLFRDVIDYAKAKLGSTSVMTAIPQKPFHATLPAKSFRMDCSKLQHLGFKPSMDVYGAIDDILTAKYGYVGGQQQDHPNQRPPEVKEGEGAGVGVLQSQTV